MSKGDDTKTLILGRALRVASTIGLEGLTIGSLADELGMSKSGLFGRFQSKESLQINVLQAGSELFRRHVIYPALKVKPGAERIVVMFEHWMDWIASGPLPGGCIFLPSFAEYDDKPGIVRETLLKIQEDWIRTLSKFVSEAIKAGDLREDIQADNFIQELYGIILSFQLYYRFLKDSKSKKRSSLAFGSLMDRAREKGKTTHHH
ncbi:AcrR family transcriptional regulator [Leptospira perolatii]|uniref:AcrR family transcriptional regulator n=1 Tax=Leptospira perolatii TaxID=2023191 RepID=A0A2M9ZM52_9LEPT|nr:TetR/AcrR family transcriptional regulator [Leptospira perolatii]PJZ69167.1 AcrR family transcriptional regulator [Leptospira perolatii]PJZ73089.1 AcrR family transcriptional regulator [Leptospira perolatii]